MDGTTVTLQQVLDAREKRALRQKALLTEHGKPLISFTMNIAGPVKNNRLITGVFRLGNTLLQDTLKTAGIPLVHYEIHSIPTGCEALYAADSTPARLKTLCAGLEDSLPVGRLFDLDVIGLDGSHTGRESLGLSPRKCLLCEKDAKVCSRSRAHSVDALQAETERLLTEALHTHTARHIASLAQKALLYEVCTTPKPGLVDCANAGSHRDMDIFTFMASSAALQPYFADCALAGLETRKASPDVTFSRLRALGHLAEQQMRRATGGVNTHKGAIFTLGILCGAMGRCGPDPEEISRQCKVMLSGLTQKDFQGVTFETAQTAGQRLYAEYGITGIRGQAEAGFPAVLKIGLPILETGLELGLSLNDAGCAALLHLIACTDDTNLIARSDRQTQLAIRQEFSALLRHDPYPRRDAITALDEQFTEKNLSCGGCADLLAATYLLHFAKNGQNPQTDPAFF